MKKIYKGSASLIAIIALLLLSVTGVKSQVYFHSFDNAPSGPPFLDAPNTGAPDIINSSWTNSVNASFRNFAGITGASLCITNPAGNTSFTFTLTFDVASGKSLNLSSYNFWARRSANGPNAWALSINGTGYGGGTLSGTSGSFIGVTPSVVNNLTGTVTIVLSLTGANVAGGGTFRVDNFTLEGTIGSTPALTATSLTDFGNQCINQTSGANTFILDGSTLSAAPVDVAALSGYTYSIDNATFTPTLSIPSASLPILVYVQFTPTAINTFNGNIVISGGGASSINVPATGVGVNTPPLITNGTVGSISSSGAIVSVTISSIGCSPISSYGVEYSTTPNFANGTGTAVASGNLSGGNYSVNLTGLVPPGQIYYIHTYATNAGGTTYGSEVSFTLLGTSPILSVPSAGAGSLSSFGSICITSSNTSSFNLSGSILNNSAITIGPLAGYSFSTAINGTYTNTLTLTNGGSPYSYTGGIVNATIFVQFAPSLVQSYNGNIPISGGGATSINVVATGTGINSAPVINAGPGILVTSTTGTMVGNITTPGCGINFEYGFRYSTTPGFVFATGTQLIVTNLAGGTFTGNLTGLTPGQTYYYYAYVINSAGTTISAINSFTCLPAVNRFVVVSVNPSSPTQNSSFSVTVEAQDASGNPVAVSANTNIFITYNGGATLTIPGFPSFQGTIPTGSSFVTMYGFSYNAVETGVQIIANGNVTYALNINIIAPPVASNLVWNSTVSPAWLTNTNWVGNVEAGNESIASPKRFDIASFTSTALPPSNAVGLNLSSVAANNYYLGTIYCSETYTGSSLAVGNSSTSFSGTFNLLGNFFINAGGTGGNNISNLMIGNYMPTGTNKNLDITNISGSGTRFLTLNLAAPGTFAAVAGRQININVLMSGSDPLAITGGGTVTLAPTGAGSINTFSGDINVENGILVAGNTGAFNTTTPNKIILGRVANAGTLRINGNSVTIGGLSTSGTASTNIVENGSASNATLTINNGTGNVFNGVIQNGSTGTLSIRKNGNGLLQLNNLNTYTGSTTINAGTLQLNNAAGGTLASGSNIFLNGGTFQVSRTQTIKDLTIGAGATLIVESGVILTITGTITANSAYYLSNSGTIILQNTTAQQSFPGSLATILAMNNLTINNSFGVLMNNSLNIAGILTLTSGIFTVGANTLTLNAPTSPANSTNLVAGNTSSLILLGTTLIQIPTSITQLKNLTISNTTGSAITSNLNINGTLYITNGTFTVGTNTLDGTANTVMTGGTITIAKAGVTLPELSGAYTLSGGTINLNGAISSTQTIRPINYFNLQINSNAVCTKVFSSTGITGIGNNLTVAATNIYTTTGSTIEFFRIATGQNIVALPYNNLILSGGNSKTVAGNFSLRGILTMSGTTKLNFIGALNVTLISDASGTARVAPVTADDPFTYTGAGRFIVERYIPAHNKAWQFLSVPTTDVTPRSINAEWQNGQSPTVVGTAGSGTIITSERVGAVSRGYDIYTPAGSTLKTYAPATDTWVTADDGTTNTNAKSLYNKKGYMLFVRGDRSIQTSMASTNATTLSTRGRLFARGSTNPPPQTTVGADLFESVGNPFASPIDFTQLTKSPNIQDAFSLWDPIDPSFVTLGRWVTFTASNNWEPLVPSNTYPAGVQVKNIQSGQAFIVRAVGGSGTIDFPETAKATNSTNVFRVAPASNRIIPSLKTTLFNLSTGNPVIVDGNISYFENNFSNDLDKNDVWKMNNGGENFGIVHASGKVLALDSRKGLNRNDTIFFKMWNMRRTHYRLVCKPKDMNDRIPAWLIDNYKGTRTSISLSEETAYDFTVETDVRSTSDNRFMIVFRSKAGNTNTDEKITDSLPLITRNNLLKNVSLSVYPNPIINKTITYQLVGWKGNYTVQLVNSSGQIILQKNTSDNSGVLTLPPAIAFGNYQLVVQLNDQKITESIVIQ